MNPIDKSFFDRLARLASQTDVEEEMETDPSVVGILEDERARAERIKNLCLMDDEFFKVVTAHDASLCVDLAVAAFGKNWSDGAEVFPQKDIELLEGKGIIVDCLLRKDNNILDVEIQNTAPLSWVVRRCLLYMFVLGGFHTPRNDKKYSIPHMYIAFYARRLKENPREAEILLQFQNALDMAGVHLKFKIIDVERIANQDTETDSEMIDVCRHLLEKDPNNMRRKNFRNPCYAIKYGLEGGSIMTQYYKDLAPRMYEKYFGEGKQEMGLEMGSRLVSSGACSLESVAKASGIPEETLREYMEKMNGGGGAR